MDNALKVLQTHSKANTNNTLAAQQTIRVFIFANEMGNHSITLTNLASQVTHANPIELENIVKSTLDVCKSCNTTTTVFTNTAKSATDALGSLVEMFNAGTGEAIKNTCADYLDTISGVKRAEIVENQLKQYLEKEAMKAMNQEKILEQIQQQNEYINQSVQSARKFASYCNFVTALLNFGMAIMTLKATCDLIQQHKELMDKEKAELKKCSSDLDNCRQQTEELMETLKSIDKQDLNISNPMFQRLYDLSDSVREIQVVLLEIKSKLNTAAAEIRVQKSLHVSGVWAGGIGALISTVASVGQIANIWNIGGIGLNILGSVAHGVGIHVCQKDIESLQDLTECTELLIHNANESIKLINSAKNDRSN
jgi:uncharacterized protein YoxC